MSVVIIGGHDRMVCQYKKVCKQFNCKAKIFTQMSASLSKQIGSPDLIVLFTNILQNFFQSILAAGVASNHIRITSAGLFYRTANHFMGYCVCEKNDQIRTSNLFA